MSEFVRFHPLRANHEGAGDVALRHVQDTVTVDVTQDDDALMAQMASAGRTAVRKAAKAGVEPRPARDLDRFRDMYVETMRRVGAAERYLFSDEFFERLERMGDGVVMLDAGCAAGLFLVRRRRDALLPLGVDRRGAGPLGHQRRPLRGDAPRPRSGARHAPPRRRPGRRRQPPAVQAVDGRRTGARSSWARRSTTPGAYAELCAAAGGADGERFPAYRR